MTAIQMFRMALGNSWRLGLCALASMVGTAIGGAAIATLGMPVPRSPGQADELYARFLLCMEQATIVN